MRLLAAKMQADEKGGSAAVELPDAALVAAAQRKPASFDALFDRYWERIFRFCFVRLNDWHMAEDVASQTFLQALRALPTFDPAVPDASFRAWLFTIARNEVAGVHRKNLRHPVVAFDDAPELIDSGDSPEESAITAERHAQLSGLLKKLPADQRDLVELRLAGLSAAEIGQTLGKSPEAVRKAQSRIVQTLRLELDPTDATPEVRS